ncbi:uncharacterized protein PFLUO_LOCUS3628 [Penicillium psychrofluorescens]|uniref:uncharacterized protein n=1 Tax=Penicillium psychrofluorescens TaxID=3158075 RepID=UPI003CCCAA7E
MEPAAWDMATPSTATTTQSPKDPKEEQQSINSKSHVFDAEAIGALTNASANVFCWNP